MIYSFILENHDIRNLLPLEIWKIISEYLFTDTKKVIGRILVYPKLLNILYEDFFDVYTFTYTVKKHKWRIAYVDQVSVIRHFFNNQQKCVRYI